MNKYLAFVGLSALLMSGAAAAAQPATNVSQSIRAGTTLSGSITWTATARPSGGVSSIHFFIDGVDTWTDTRSPYQFNGDPNGKLDTTTLSNGTHTFRVIASWSRHARASSTVTATVSNATTPPPLPAQCADGIDNDGDGLIDMADPGCTSPSDNDETDPAPPGTEPAPIAGQGYHLTFGDEFNTLDRSVWDDHIWYDEIPHPAWLNFQTVHDGELDLATAATDLYSGCSSLCYPLDTVTTLSSGHSFQYGYFEARMKWTRGAGAWPAFWLIRTDWANGSGGCPGYAGEIDVFEGQGTEPSVFYGTVHKDSACGDDQQNGNNYQPVGVDLTAGFHTYAALWTSTTITWYLDDKPLMSAPTYSTDNAPMFLLLQMWSGGWTSDPSATTPAVLHTQVDWVHVWQK